MSFTQTLFSTLTGLIFAGFYIGLIVSLVFFVRAVVRMSHAFADMSASLREISAVMRNTPQ